MDRPQMDSHWAPQIPRTQQQKFAIAYSVTLLQLLTQHRFTYFTTCYTFDCIIYLYLHVEVIVVQRGTA